MSMPSNLNHIYNSHIATFDIVTQMQSAYAPVNSSNLNLGTGPAGTQAVSSNDQSNLIGFTEAILNTQGSASTDLINSGALNTRFIPKTQS